MSTIALPVELHAIEKLREAELEEARSIQNVMLPMESLRAGKVRISHAFQPVTEVGGDFLDYFELTDGCVGLYLGDVSGKGLPAAMYAALAVGTLRGVHKTGLAASQVLTTLNRRLMIRGTPRRHAAVQYAVFDPRTREMQISGAGMPGPFQLSAGAAASWKPREYRQASLIRRWPTRRCGSRLSRATPYSSSRTGYRTPSTSKERASAWNACKPSVKRNSIARHRNSSGTYFRRWTASLTAEHSMTTWRLPFFISPTISLSDGSLTPPGTSATVLARTASNLCCLSGDASFVHPASGVVH